MRAKTVTRKIPIQETLLINHHYYDSVSLDKFHTIKVGPDGIIADNGVHVDWGVIEKLLNKYKNKTSM